MSIKVISYKRLIKNIKMEIPVKLYPTEKRFCFNGLCRFRLEFKFPESKIDTSLNRNSTIIIFLCNRYACMIKATGRYFCDFLQNVDNIHMQMRFTYPKMKSPSMYTTHIDPQGVELVYRSTRKGFTHYLLSLIHI